MAISFPSNASVKIGDAVVNTFSTNAGISSIGDPVYGMPQIGSMGCTFEFSADIHDQKSVPFDTVRALWNLAYLPDSTKITDISISFWTDEKRTDVILTISFKGWLSSWNVISGGGKNHILSFTVQPKLEKGQYVDLKLGN